MGGDSITQLVAFFSKRDGIDKLVKTFQYVSKLTHWKLEHINPDLALRAKKLEVQCGLSRKVFRAGRFISGFDTLRTTHYPDWKVSMLSALGYGGEMIYFLFDHFTLLSKIGVLDADMAAKFSFISAFGEAFGYTFFIWLDLILIQRGMVEEKMLKQKLKQKTKSKHELTSLLTLLLNSEKLSSFAVENESKSSDLKVKHEDLSLSSLAYSTSSSSSSTSSTSASTPSNLLNSNNSLTWRKKHVESNSKALLMNAETYEKDIEVLDEEIKKLQSAISFIRFQRAMRAMGIFANVADLVIALAEIEPRPIYCHPLTLGISGLVSAWCGWFRVWPR